MKKSFRELCKEHPELRKFWRERATWKGPKDRLHLNARAQLKLEIDAKAEDGQVIIVYGGMDCDGASSAGNKWPVQASVMAVNKVLDCIYDGAEGPMSAGIYSPSEAQKIKRSFRDYGMEAFEDGHQHSYHYAGSHDHA